MINNKEVAVIGLGPGGVSACIYLKRYGMIPFAFEKELVGGKINKTESIENYAGVLKTEGASLGEVLTSQLESFEIEPIYEEVSKVTHNADGSFTVTYGENSHDFSYVILACGLKERPFEIKGASDFSNKGISRCAICDGAFYRNKEVAVIGGGNSAFEEASYLAEICSKVTLIARRTQFRADSKAVEVFSSHPNARIMAPYEVVCAKGDSALSSLVIRNSETLVQEELNISALFIYVGDIPTTSFLSLDGIFDVNGYVKTDSKMSTSVPNLYAIGDCRDTLLRQVATATSDGAVAASAIHSDYLNNSQDR
ncbi:MAG: FAD-dependent oxidoreductase [Bacilli bacterium]